MPRRAVAIILGVAAAICAVAVGAALLKRPQPQGELTAPPSRATTSLTLELAGDAAEPLRLRIHDFSETMLGARAATERERVMGYVGDLSTVAALNPDGNERELLLRWIGSRCDVGAELTISVDPAVMLLEQDPREACDAAGIGQAVVLELSRPLPAASVRVTFRRFRAVPYEPP